jgi:hypothetical protein
MEALKPPPAVQSGLRAARSIDGLEILDDLRYFEAIKKWAVRFIIDIFSISNPYIPRRSEWFLVIDPFYPLGSINIYPSKKNSVAVTFNHQDLNQYGSDDLPWRTGKLCLDEQIQRFGLIAGGTEPIGNREGRLKWHMARSIAWVHAAATNKLIQNGDPFELPYLLDNKLDIRVVHDESSQSLPAWNNALGDWGLVVWDSISGIENSKLAVAFLAKNGRIIRATSRYNETRHGSGNSDRETGLWWLWPSPIVLDPWQAPLTWNELRIVGQKTEIVVDDCLREIARTIRGKGAKLLLLGYPIPARYGQKATEIHWQAIRLPKLNRGKPRNGFRPNEMGWWFRDLQGAFAGRWALEYILTENWHPERMQARGRLDQPLRDSRIALIGCGALGSVLAELLVRGGVADVLLIDHELLTAGNLGRHMLDGQDIGKKKASALAQRLSSVAPFSSIRPNGNKLPELKAEIEELLEDRNMVIDCTGSDEVIHSLGLGWWSLPRLFVSASVGYKARRTFIFLHRGNSFPKTALKAKINPLLEEERALWSQRGETLEGAGCWSPLFPARFDDLLLAAGSCVKVIEEFTGKDIVEARLIVFEQTSDDGFTGLRRHEIPHNQSGRSE